MLLCPCCNKPINHVQNIEPAASWPDEIAAMDEDEKRRRCVLSPDVCAIDLETSSVKCFVRGVIPFPVHGRDRPFNWGAWVRLTKFSLDNYVQMSAAEQSGMHIDEDPELWWPARLANDLCRYTDVPTLDESVKLRWQSGNKRPHIVFYDGSDNRLAKMQREGVDLEQTLRWTAPFHAMVSS